MGSRCSLDGEMLGGACLAGEQCFRLATYFDIRPARRQTGPHARAAAVRTRRYDPHLLWAACSEGGAKKCQKFVEFVFPIVPTGRAALRKYSTGAPTPSAQPINFCDRVQAEI